MSRKSYTKSKRQSNVTVPGAEATGQGEGRVAGRWHPYAVDSGIDYSKEPMTLITFSLEDQQVGILLTVTESGFDSIPLARRADALKAHEAVGVIQLGRIKK